MADTDTGNLTDREYNTVIDGITAMLALGVSGGVCLGLLLGATVVHSIQETSAIDVGPSVALIGVGVIVGGLTVLVYKIALSRAHRMDNVFECNGGSAE